jgi:hypothetical protein
MIKATSLRHPLAVLVFLIACAAFQPVMAQQSFSGRITFEISYAGSRIDFAEQEQLPQRVEVVARNNRVRTEMKAGVLKQVKIANADTRSTITLLEIEDGKYAIEKSPDEIEAQIEEMSDVSLVFTDEFETILGYTCRKVLATTYDAYGEQYTSEIYFTEELDGFPLQFDTPYRDIPGLMLRYEIRAGTLVMQYEAVSIERQRWIGGRHFRVPSGYEVTTFEALREKLSGEF